ncbi:MAG TPA: hypothetical protein VEK73_07520 [Xanthobacteraceae bacterium]|nr:hypothetical protein [Xanthobacteraceae bacterium]
MIRYVLAMLLMTTPALAQAQGLALWGKIYEVFSHPRCANCHVGSDNLPMWSGPEYGRKARPHGMNISGGASRKGAESIACNTCHTPHNAQVQHGPPGAEVWQLAPVSMQWFGKSSADICAQIKDPARNGRRKIVPEAGEPVDMHTIVGHIAIDKLVHWGWEPGPGRQPAPYSAAQLIEFLKQWDAAGAPCPTN